MNKQDIRFIIKFASADCPWVQGLIPVASSLMNNMLVGSRKMFTDDIPGQTIKQSCNFRIRLEVVTI